MFSKMESELLSNESDATISLEEMTRRGVRGKPDVSALASRGGNRVTVLVWQYHDDDLPGPEASIELSLHGIVRAETASVQHFRIGEEHSKAFIGWQKI